MTVNPREASSPSLLRVAVRPFKDWFNLITNKDGQVSVSGLEGCFLDTVLKALGYRYELVIPSDGEWGRVKDGNWTGMIGEVVSNRADIAFNWISVNDERQEVVDFSSSYYQEIATFGVIKPDPLPTAITIFYPFDVAVWACLFVVLITMPVIFLLTKARQPYIQLFLQVFGSVLKQPLTVQNNSPELMFLLIAWLLFTTLISSFYSSVLLSFLTKPLEQKTIKTFRELSDAVRKGEMECYSSQKSNVLTYLLQSAEEHVRFLGEIIEKNGWYGDTIATEEGPIQTKKNLAIINSDIFFQKRNRVPGSMFMVVSHDILFTTNIAVAMRKDFCCKERINKMITRVKESGLYDFYLRKFIYNSVVNENSHEDEFKSLSVSDVAGTLFIYLSGISLSLLTFIAEVLSHKFKRIIDLTEV